MASLAMWLMVGGTVLVSGEAAGGEESASARVQMADRTAAFLENLLGDDRMTSLHETLAAEQAWGSLGPHPTGELEPLPVDPPARQIELTIPDDAEGAGTAEDPYLDVISAFLDDHFAYDPTSIEAYYSYPDEGAVAAYVETLSYEPTLVRIPEGHYTETTATFSRPYRRTSEITTGVDVPPAVWLEGDGEVVIEPRVEEGERGSLINLNIRSGLLNVTLDGRSLPSFAPSPNTRITAVTAAHEAVIAHNHIRDFTGHGVNSIGSRGREGSDGVAINNVISNIGHSGMRTQSRWLIRDNQIRYAGVLRPGGGHGDDAVIPAWGVQSEIVNNLFVMERRPWGRHSISGQGTHENTIAGNITIVDGALRNNIGLSDGSHNNEIFGNAVLAVREWYSGGQQLAGISANGYGNDIHHNFIVGHPVGVIPRGREGEELVQVRNNYIEYIRQEILWQYSREYVMTGNRSKRSGHRHEDLMFGSPLSAGPGDPVIWEGDFAFRMESEFGFFQRQR